MLRVGKKPVRPFCKDWKKYMDDPMPIQVRVKEQEWTDGSEEAEQCRLERQIPRNSGPGKNTRKDGYAKIKVVVKIC